MVKDGRIQAMHQSPYHLLFKSLVVEAWRPQARGAEHHPHLGKM
jgi:hypothetical protein